MDSKFERLLQLKERKHELVRSESKRENIQSLIRKQEKLVNSLKVQCEMEQEDIDKLTKMSLTNLFHTILRSKQGQLEIERHQLLSATLKLQEAEQELAELQAELIDQGNQRLELGNVEKEINELMLQKEAYLRTCSDHARELDQMDEQISDQRMLVKEIKEAVVAGKAVLDALLRASESLEKAENWGNWDLWMNGGLLSTHMKHSHIDDARDAIHAANHYLKSFNKELADLNKTVNVHFEMDGFVKMADYWFDGLIVDWVVQGRIKNSQEQTLDALNKMRPIVTKLETEQRSAEQTLEGFNYNRKQWVIQSNKSM